jgi:hypothetical protein
MTPRQLNRLEQEAELRFLRRYIQRLAARIAELEAILAPVEPCPIDALRAELRERNLGG